MESPPEDELRQQAGAWEVRVHREGQASLAGRFTLPPEGSEEKRARHPRAKLGVPLAKTETPRDIASALARIPSACKALCPWVTKQAARAPGKYASSEIGTSVRGGACARPPTPAHLAHWKSASANIPHPRMFTAEELRASVRSDDATKQRAAINQLLYFGKTTVERGDWQYDRNQSPDANWHRRRAFEARDTQGQEAEEGQRHAQALRRVPALDRAIREGGAPFRADEVPAGPAETIAPIAAPSR